MIVGIPKEIQERERRVAATPLSVKKLQNKLKTEVLIESTAGLGAFYRDDQYEAVGASIAADSAEIFAKADIIAKVQPPTAEEIQKLREGSILVSTLQPHADRSRLEALAERKITAFSLEWVPRITRAQSMDILSSQANLAGYKAVMMAAENYPRLFPMLMTAAGTVRAAKVLVLGAGVAGLQAIATAKRLGAIVSAFDVRAAVKEQVQSLGADFVELDIGLEDAETQAGYARALTEDEQKRQVEALAEVIKGVDIVITTAAIPGKPAPKLILAEAVRGMGPGSVIVDLAAETGGNCELTQPGETVVENNVTILGPLNIPSLVSAEASNLFSLNVFNFLANLAGKEGDFAINLEDDIIKGSLITHDGAIVHEQFKVSGGQK